MRNEPKVVYRPVIRKMSDYRDQVSYRNTKGKNVQYQVEDKSVALPKALSQIVSGKKPNVDKEELLLKFWELYGRVQPTCSGHDAIMNRAEKLIDCFAPPESPAFVPCPPQRRPSER